MTDEGQSNNNQINTSELNDSDMCLISKNYLFEGMLLPVPLFLRLKENTFVLLAKKGENAQVSSMKGFRNESFKVYVRNFDRIVLNSYIENITSKTIEHPQVPLQQKQNFVSALLETSIEEFEKSGFTNTHKLKSIGQLISKLSRQIPSVASALDLLQSAGVNNSTHSMMTAMLSIMIATEAELTNNLVEEKILIGALLHDIGLRTLPPELLAKKRTDWTSEDVALYEQHPIRGAEMLRATEGMSVEVLQIVAEHHENSIGTGFPKKIRDVKMNNLSKIVALADIVAEMLIGVDGTKRYTPDECIIYIEDVLGQPYNKTIFRALKNIVNVDHLHGKIKKSA